VKLPAVFEQAALVWQLSVLAVHSLTSTQKTLLDASEFRVHPALHTQSFLLSLPTAPLEPELSGHAEHTVYQLPALDL